MLLHNNYQNSKLNLKLRQRIKWDTKVFLNVFVKMTRFSILKACFVVLLYIFTRLSDVDLHLRVGGIFKIRYLYISKTVLYALAILLDSSLNVAL